MLDREKIIQQMTDIISYNTPRNIYINPLYVEKIYDLWAENKKTLLESEVFQNNLIVKKAVDIELGVDDLLVHQDWTIFKDILCSYVSNTKLEQFINHHLDIETYRNNKLTHTWDSNLKQGMRLTKAICKLLPNTEDAEKVINIYSNFIQNYRIKGYLCLSIHPLDYLSISENASNWTSCHSLEGEYGSGNLSYMCDSSTVVAYLSSTQDKEISGFPTNILWNDKKWRTLLHFNDTYDKIIINKQYPYKNEKIHNLLIDTFFADYENKTLSASQAQKLINYYSLNTNAGPDTPLFYSDIMYNLELTFTLLSKPKDNRLDVFVIGKSVPCLQCGEELNISNGFVCCNCNDDYTQCSICGGIVERNNIVYINGDKICEYCFEENVVICDGCGEQMLKEEEGDTYFVTEDFSIYCADCYKEWLDNQEEFEEKEV